MFHTQIDNQLGKLGLLLWINYVYRHVAECFSLNMCIVLLNSDHKRERGNFWYDRAEYNLAIQLYRRSLEYLDDTDKYVGDSSKLEEVSSNR